jgi:hypothetical protein
MRLIIFVLIITGYVANASNAILFTENGEKFTAILNGVRQNDKPETNVKITGLNAEVYKLKVIFENPGSGEKNMNLYINTGTETSYCIRKNNKGEYVLRLVSEVPVAQAPMQTPSQKVIVYNSNPASSPQVETVTRTSTTTVTNSTPENISIDRNDGRNISIQTAGVEETHSTTVIHTTSYSSDASGNNPNEIYVAGYTGPIGCTPPLTEVEFEDIKGSISSKTFEDTRMTIAKQALADHCVITSQIKQLMQLFTFEENKLEFAKFAYDHTYDIGNYFTINDAFKFDSSIEALNNYLMTQK